MVGVPTAADSVTATLNGENREREVLNGHSNEANDGGETVPNGPPQELSAAAAFLEKFTGTANLGATIDRLSEAGESLEATKALAKAFISALAVVDAPVAAAASLEGCMQVLMMWLKECNMDEGLVSQIATDLLDGKTSPDLRLRCLALLYNGVDEDRGQLRFDLLVRVIRLAEAVDMVPRISKTVLPSVDMFVKQWRISTVDKRKLYKACYSALLSSGAIESAFTFNVKQLELYNGATESELASVESDAVAAIVDAVRLPSLYRFDTLLELNAVQRLEKAGASGGDKNLGLLFELLNIFVKEDLDAYTSFSDRNGPFLDEFKIDRGVSVEKMRLLTFASLGLDSQDLSYTTIATALKIEEAEVEEWVIRAISSGLTDAKINQLKSSVSVYRSTQRMFTREEWQPLSERINIWKENIGDLLTSLRETRQASAAAAADAFAG